MKLWKFMLPHRLKHQFICIGILLLFIHQIHDCWIVCVRGVVRCKYIIYNSYRMSWTNWLKVCLKNLYFSRDFWKKKTMSNRFLLPMLLYYLKKFRYHDQEKVSIKVLRTKIFGYRKLYYSRNGARQGLMFEQNPNKYRHSSI